MNKSFFFRIALAVILPFMFLMASLSFYYGNINEINFSLSDVIFPVAALILAGSLILFLILSLFRNRPRLFSVTGGVLAGVAMAIWIQSQLFAWKFGPLDGQSIDWSQWKIQMWIEGIVWFLVIVSMIILFYRGLQKPCKIILQGLFLLGFISVMTSFISAPSKIKPVYSETQYQNVFSFHPKNNVIVILLDAFQSDYFDLIRKEYPKEVSYLDGFTFYPNTMSNFPTTAPNIPAILTGKLFLNQEKFEKFFQDSVLGNDLMSYYRSKGYTAKKVGVFPKFPTQLLSMKQLLNYYDSGPSAPWYLFLDYGVFRCIPTIAKKRVYNNGLWFLSFWKAPYSLPAQYGDDTRFTEVFQKTAAVVSDSAAGTFKFIHFYTPHEPLCVDENLRYNPDLELGANGYIRQARGALTLARRILNKLRELNLYDCSEIVIMSDHGSLIYPPIVSSMGMVPRKVRSSSMALLLHKPPFARGEMVVNEMPLMNSDLGCLLQVESNNLDYKGFNAAKNGEVRPRSYFFYDWQNDWDRDYFPKMTEYIVTGDVRHGENWRLGYRTYSSSGVEDISAIHDYILNKVIVFSDNGLCDHYVLGGWGDPEPTHRWTEGPKARLRFRLNSPVKEDLLLQIKGYAYLANGKIDHQNVDVTVNGKKLAEWKVKDEQWYKTIIPKNLITDKMINVLLEIDNPTSPYEVDRSKDTRKLGMSVEELSIRENQ